VDETTAQEAMVIIDTRRIASAIVITMRRASRWPLSIPSGAHIVSMPGTNCGRTLMAKTPRKTFEDEGHHRRSAACG